MEKKLNIRHLDCGERYWAAYAGELRNVLSGKVSLLKRAQVDVFYALKELGPDKQVEMLYFALVKAAQDFARRKGHRALDKKFLALQKKFGRVWHPNAKHVLPVLKELPWTSMLRKEHINRENAEMLFKALLNYEIVLYAPFHISCEQCRTPNDQV